MNAVRPLVRFYPRPYSVERYVPYRVLWLRVIIRAAYDYALWRESKDLKLRKFAQDAERWLFDPSELLNSFETICGLYNFPIEKLREWAKSLTRDQVKKLEFRERYGRDFWDAILETTPLLEGAQARVDGEDR